MSKILTLFRCQFSTKRRLTNTQQNDYWPCLTKLNPQPPSESLFLAKILFQPATPHSFSWSQRSESLRGSPRLVFFLRGDGRVPVAASATL